MARGRLREEGNRVTEALTGFLRINRDAPAPLVTQLAQQLTWLIVRGQVPPGEQLPPVREFARELDINMHTVRAAYQTLAANGLVDSRPGTGTVVTEYDREKLHNAVPDLPTFTIGVVLPGLDPFYTPLVDAVEARLQDLPLMMYLFNTRDTPLQASRAIDQLVSRGADGIILVSQYPPDLDTSVSAHIPPWVVVDWPPALEPSVVFDLESGAVDAVDHLIAVHGHERIGLIAPPRDWANVAAVYSGRRRALQEAGVVDDPELISIVPDFQIESGTRGVEKLLDLPVLPTAILCAGDLLAAGALLAVRARGRVVPDDVALIGIGDLGTAELLDPALTTVRLPAAEMGTKAADKLLVLLAGDTPDNIRDVLDAELVIRRSCGCPQS